MEVLNISGLTECPKEKGALLYAITTKVKPQQQNFLAFFVKMVTDSKWNRTQQLDEGIKWLDEMIRAHGSDYKLDQKEFDEATGVGIVVTKEMIEASIDQLIEDHKADINE